MRSQHRWSTDTGVTDQRLLGPVPSWTGPTIIHARCMGLLCPEYVRVMFGTFEGFSGPMIGFSRTDFSHLDRWLGVLSRLATPIALVRE